MGLPTIHAVMDKVLHYNYLVEADAWSYFYQFPLSGGAEDVFRTAVGSGARGNFKVMRMQVLPMGFSFAPAIAQETSNFLCEVIKGRAVGGQTDILVWVDNFIIVGQTVEDVRAMTRVANGVFAEVGLQLKAPFGDPERVMEVLGLQFDLVRHVVTIPRAMRERLKAVETQEAAIKTVREVARILGTVLWCNWTVACTPLCAWPSVQAMMRRVGLTAWDTQSWETGITLPPAVAGELGHLARVIGAAGYRLEPAVPSGQEAWCSDASSVGTGVVRRCGDRVEAWMGPPWPRLNIYAAELLCLVVALCQAVEVEVCTDNSGALRAVINGHSSACIGNMLLRIMLRNRGKAAPRCRVAWVSTTKNPADAPSRGHMVSMSWPTEVTFHRPTWRNV
jgi:hypothetical protein